MNVPLFQKRKPVPITYDANTQTPAVRRSICTGEMTLGFADRDTGKFHEYALARDQRELEAFCAAVGVAPDQLKTIY